MAGRIVVSVFWLLICVNFGSANAVEEAPLRKGAAAVERGDYREAVKFYRIAADEGNPFAATNLGAMYHDGVGVTQNFAEAAKWYRIAADRGHDVAMVAIGHMYRTGTGIPKDLVQAHKWFNIAASREKDPKKRRLVMVNRDHVGGQMTPAMIVKAQQLAQDWKADLSYWER